MTATGLRLYRTAPHACGYYDDRIAQDLVLDPQDPMLPRAYAFALAQGYRRSGALVYRPRCEGCGACVPVRVPVDAFRPDRSQRRCLRRNADLHIATAPVQRGDEHFELYRRYLAARHRDGGMDDATPESFDAFLACDWSPTRFLELRLHDRLIAVAATDVLPDALSAVYTFFDPDQPARGLGTRAILAQIDWARGAGLSYLYLGFWLAGHPKMDYKIRYRPIESFLDGRWQRHAIPLRKVAATRSTRVSVPPADVADTGNPVRAVMPAPPNPEE